MIPNDMFVLKFVSSFTQMSSQQEQSSRHHAPYYLIHFPGLPSVSSLESENANILEKII